MQILRGDPSLLSGFWVNTVLGSHLGVGEFTTHVRTHSGDWDVHWGCDLDCDPWPCMGAGGGGNSCGRHWLSFKKRSPVSFLCRRPRTPNADRCNPKGIPKYSTNPQETTPKISPKASPKIPPKAPTRTNAWTSPSPHDKPKTYQAPFPQKHWKEIRRENTS